MVICIVLWGGWGDCFRGVRGFWCVCGVGVVWILGVVFVGNRGGCFINLVMELGVIFEFGCFV